MPFDAVTALRIGASDVRAHYSCRDTILYALGLGMGGDPFDPDQIAFVYEGQGSPRVMPTLPVVLVPSNTHSLGLDMTRVLHGEQRLTLHAALAPEGDVISDTRTHSIIDKGEDRGAIANIETIGRRADDGAPLFTMIKSLFARGDGGCGAPTAAPPQVHRLPERPPPLAPALSTRPYHTLHLRPAARSQQETRR